MRNIRVRVVVRVRTIAIITRAIVVALAEALVVQPEEERRHTNRAIGARAIVSVAVLLRHLVEM